MTDFSTEFLQHRQTRSVLGEELEMLGKHAAQRYAAGEGTLNETVLMEVKRAALSQEQVRRVIEFANTAAFLQDFSKEGTAHRVVEFHGGPADPSIILQNLNDGGSSTKVDHGALDYQSSPSKHASARDEEALRGLFESNTANTLPEENPLGDVVDFRDKVAGLSDHLTSELSGLETLYDDLCRELYDNVKQAALDGSSLGDVVYAWSTVTDDPTFVSAAFEMLSPRLEGDGVFRNGLEICSSLEKVASAQTVNLEHPLVTGFSEYCQVLTKLASTRADRDEALYFLKQATDFLTSPNPGDQEAFIQEMEAKLAGPGGLVGKVVRGAEALSGPAGEGAQALGKLLVGPGQGAQTLGKAVGGAVKYAPHAVGAALAVRGAQHLSASGAGQELQSFVPGTQAYQQKQWELQQRYGNQGGGFGY